MQGAGVSAIPNDGRSTWPDGSRRANEVMLHRRLLGHGTVLAAEEPRARPGDPQISVPRL
jgi:hypothetical protein